MFGLGRGPPPILERTWFKIYCRADEGYSLTVRDNAVVLARANPSDGHQHWYKDTRHSGSVKDEEGQPAFALVNKATGLAIKHSPGQSNPVELVPYSQEYKNASLMWTESKDVGKGFRCIRMATNIGLNFDAFHGDKDHGGVRDGTILVLWECWKGKNQSWKIQPLGAEADAPPPACDTGVGHNAAWPLPAQQAGSPCYGAPTGRAGVETYPPPSTRHWYPAQPGPCDQQPVVGVGYGYGYGNANMDSYPMNHTQGHFGSGGAAPASAGVARYGNIAAKSTVRILCRANEEYNLTVRNSTVCLAPANPADDFQHWVKDMRRSTSIRDEEGHPAFALVNKITGEAIKHSLGQSHPVKLVSYNPEIVDESVLWTESKDVGDGFRCIRMVSNIYLNFDAFHGDKDHGGVHDGTTIVLWEWCKGDNQSWKILPY